MDTEGDATTKKSETVANVENPNESTNDTNPPKSEKKAPKRKKVKKTQEVETPANHDEAGNVMPTAPPSKRQKKRQKKMKNVVRNKDQDIERAIAYLEKWDTNRDEWKYEKLRQIFIQKHIFDDSVIPSDHCDTAIRYLATSKGHSRSVIIKAAEDIMKEIEDKLTDENQEELTSSVKYERAREILQTMQE